MLIVHTQLNDGGEREGGGGGGRGVDVQTFRPSQCYQNIPCWNGAVVDCRMGGGEPFFGDPFCVNPEDNQSNQIIIIINIVIAFVWASASAASHGRRSLATGPASIKLPAIVVSIFFLCFVSVFFFFCFVYLSHFITISFSLVQCVCVYIGFRVDSFGHLLVPLLRASLIGAIYLYINI